MANPQQAEVIEDTVSMGNGLTDFEAETKWLGELELPSEDGIPLESNWHRIQMNLLIDSVHWHWRDRDDYFTGGNMFVYFSMNQVFNQDFRGPDFFVVKDTDGRNRDSWITWKEDGRSPNVIVELMSPSTINADLNEKKRIYERILRTPEYFCFDPAKNRLVGWKNTGGFKELRPNDKGRLRTDELGLWLGVWEGVFQRVNAVWLRFYDDDGQLILTASEAEARRAEAEAQRADQAEAELNRLKEELARLKKET